MNGFPKFILIGVGGTVGLLVMGMLIMVGVSGVQPGEFKGVNLIKELELYRIGFYIALVIFWPLIAKFLTRSREDLSEHSESFKSEILERQKKDYNYVKSLWWKVATLSIFFEVVMVRQFGL